MYTCREERYPARRPSSSAHGQPISINPVSDQIGARSERIYAASDRIYTSGSLRPTCPLARGGKLYPRIGSNREKFRFSQVFFVFRIFGRGGEEGAEQGSCKGKGEGVGSQGGRANEFRADLENFIREGGHYYIVSRLGFYCCMQKRDIIYYVSGY